jgi:hypothetical protein
LRRRFLILARGNTVSSFKAATKMRHVRKPPSLRNFCYGSMGLVGIFKSKPATREPSGENQTVKRGILFGKQRIGISEAYSNDIGDLLSVKVGIAEFRFYH